MNEGNAKHVYVKCRICGKQRRIDKVSSAGVCVSCYGEAFLDFVKKLRPDVISILHKDNNN